MSRTRKMTIGAAGFALAAMSVLFSSSTASAINENMKITNGNSGKCLAVPGSSEVSGRAVVQWECTANHDQIWYALRVSGGNGDRVRLSNYNSKQCLSIAAETQGAAAIQRPCSGSEQQTWVWDSADRLRNVSSGYCLAVPHASTANNTELIVWRCTLDSEQRWIGHGVVVIDPSA
ncbi:RICIN domain-containing protein [Streptomyces bottropensis]|uniref:RICIN domain-containing protein n=1 Tax=Streptomyces bottropensis TaxID=42235 RepID=UPI003829FCBC